MHSGGSGYGGSTAPPFTSSHPPFTLASDLHPCACLACARLVLHRCALLLFTHRLSLSSVYAASALLA
jgi:hypothetical protein